MEGILPPLNLLLKQEQKMRCNHLAGRSMRHVCAGRAPDFLKARQEKRSAIEARRSAIEKS